MSELINVVVEAPPVLAQPLAVPANQSPTIVEQFGALFAQAEEWRQKAHAIRVTDVSQTDAMKLARESRLALRRIRCDVENRRKDLKEEALRSSQTIDGIARVFRNLVEPIEEYLEKQETFPDRLEAAMKEALRSDRSAQLSRLGFDHSAYELGAMPGEQFNALVKLAENMVAEREKAAREAEAERVRKEIEAAEEKRRAAEALVAARIEAEKARAEAERREAELQAQLKEQREAAAKKQEEDRKIRIAAEAEAKRAREEAEAKEKALLEEAAKKQAAERKRREAAEAETKRLRAAEDERLAAQRVAEAEANRKREAAAAADDDTKLRATAREVALVLGNADPVTSKAGVDRWNRGRKLIEQGILILRGADY